MSDFLQQSQADIHGRLLAATALAKVPIILQRSTIDEDAVKRRLGALDARSGTTGACVVVLMPEITVPATEAPGPLLVVTQSCLVLEHPTVNNGDKGTGMSAEEIAIAVLHQLHHFRAGGAVQTYTGVGRAIVPDNQVPGLVGYLVTVQARAGIDADPRQPTPDLSVAGSTITVSADPSAAVYFTLDGSYPHAGNTAATLYAAPVTVSEPGTFRAVAYRTGYLPSNVASAEIT